MLGAVVVIVATGAYGPGLTPDSAHYFSAADSLVAGQGLLDAAGEPYRFFPPAYPLVLGVFGRLGVPLPIAARALNALSFAIVIGVVCALVYRLTASGPTSIATGAFVLMSAPMIDALSYALSEGLFVALLALFVWVFSGALSRGAAYPLLASALIGSTLPLTRYAGVVVIPAAVLVLLLMSEDPARRRFQRALIFCAVALVPLAAYLARNLVVTGQLTGARNASAATTIMVLRGFVASAGDWFVPWQWIMRLQAYSDAPWALALLFLAAGGFTFAVAFDIRRWWSDPTTGRDSRCTAAFLAVWIAAYSTFLCVTARLVAFNPLGPRFLVPILFPAVVLLAVAAHASTRPRPGEFSLAPRLRIVFMILIAAVVSLQGWRATALIVDKRSNGAGGYATRTWQTSPMWAYVRATRPPAGALSNAPDVIYLAAGERRGWSPRRDRPEQVGALRDALDAGQDVPVVWFDGIDWRPYLVPLGTLRDAVGIEAAHRELDGGIYRR